MHILVVGGAGYIGSHTVKALRQAGHDVTSFDSLERGHAASLKGLIPPDRQFNGNILNQTDLDRVF
ncbi:MAG: NAD-dependent epimerase/dehydratase family protein, partial [Thaumarchaeota archaeon]|nr:NAD-dependent epimerase/dehydratase family protein [Nitrososphaerota archaeon]